MNCYLCETHAHSNGTRYAVSAAVGICRNCGIAICLEHSHKADEAGSPLLCAVCAGRNIPATTMIERSDRQTAKEHIGQ